MPSTTVVHPSSGTGPGPSGMAAPIFRGTNVWQLVEMRARTGPERPAMIWHPFVGPPRTWTYRELERDAAALATGMTRRGIRAGDRVLIHLENCPEFVLAWYACAAIGAVAVTTNSRSAAEELRYFADHSRAAAVITQPRFAELAAESAPAARWVVATDHDAGDPAPDGRRPDRTSSFASLMADPADLQAVPADPFAPMSVQYTSGTTSRPKGVLWTQANALWGAKVNAVHEDLHPDDCHLCYLPLFHTNALAYSMLASLWVGARFVLVPKWSSSRFWDISLQHGCTWLSLMGLSARVVAASTPPERHTYRLFGAPVCDGPWDAMLGVKTIGWWGMTETISHGTVGDPYVPNRPLSMGRPAPEYGIAVVDDDGAPTEPDEAGHLLVKGIPGVSLFAEYLDNPRATADSFDDEGWFRTGDLVIPHVDGHITFADRSKDMLKVGAENVAASEVERVVLEVPGVVEAAVVGRADDTLDEVPVAFVRVSDGGPDVHAAIVDACRERLADFKRPRDVYVVDHLPRSTLSKINKVELRAVAAPDADRDTAEALWREAASTDPSGDAP